jgi:hypothetical protein
MEFLDISSLGATYRYAVKIEQNLKDEPEEGEYRFHSDMWVKGTPLHFIIDSSRKKNLILEDVFK